MIRIHHLLLCCIVVLLLWPEEGSAQPIWDRVTQLAFEPNRLNYWYNAWEKLFHLGRYHVYKLPNVVALPLHGVRKAIELVHNIRL